MVLITNLRNLSLGNVSTLVEEEQILASIPCLFKNSSESFESDGAVYFNCGIHICFVNSVNAIEAVTKEANQIISEDAMMSG